LVSLLDKGNGFAAESESRLRAVAGVERVRRLDGEAGEVHFEVLPNAGDDLRPLLFKAAVDAGFTLIGLAREGQNLEQIFRELTTSGGDAPADKAAAPAS
jgi:hypothetical protein